MTLRAVLLCGGGRRADRWHDLAGTGQAVAGLLAGHGVTTRMTSRIMDVVVGGRIDADLLVVNCSDGPRDPEFDGTDGDWAPLGEAILAHVAAGRPVLGLHTAAIAFPDLPGWHRLLGARWVHGTSMHPDLGSCTVRLHPTPTGIADGLPDVRVEDERYSYLDLDPTLGPIVPHATHLHDGVSHPLAWGRVVPPGGARVVYDALGHDLRSYESPSRRALLSAEVEWLLESR